MLTYTGSRNLYGTLTNNSTTGNLTNGDTLINDFTRQRIGSFAWSFMERTRQISTVASTQYVEIPADCEKVIAGGVTVTIGTEKYTPRESPSREHWNRLNSSTSVLSDIPEWYYVDAGKIYFYPTPASSTSNAVSVTYKRRHKDLNVADITSTTIATLTLASTALTVSAGLTVQMAGFYIRPTFTTTANSGDGNWYEIASVTNATTATLVKPYLGTSIAAGTAACTIGQASLLPEEYQSMPVYDAAAIYWDLNGDSDRSLKYKAIADAMFERMKQTHGSKTTSVVIDDDEVDQVNPNLTVQL